MESVVLSAHCYRKGSASHVALKLGVNYYYGARNQTSPEPEPSHYQDSRKDQWMVHHGATSPQQPTPIRKSWQAGGRANRHVSSSSPNLSRDRRNSTTSAEDCPCCSCSSDSSPISKLSASPLVEANATPDTEFCPPVLSSIGNSSSWDSSYSYRESLNEVNFRRHSHSSRRRSSFLSKCMLKDRSYSRPTGYDTDGHETFSVQLTESQGFRWNHTIYDMVDDVAFEDVFE